MKFSTRRLTFTAAIAAIYVVLTVTFAPLSFGWIQFRVSEALTILPFFTPLAIPGLTIGVLIANLYSSAGVLDLIFGPLATLIAAILTSKIKNKWLAPLPPVIINAIIIGVMLGIVFSSEVTIPVAMLSVGIGELGVLYTLGLILMFVIERRAELNKFFKEL